MYFILLTTLYWYFYIYDVLYYHVSLTCILQVLWPDWLTEFCPFIFLTPLVPIFWMTCQSPRWSCKHHSHLNDYDWILWKLNGTHFKPLLWFLHPNIHRLYDSTYFPTLVLEFCEIIMKDTSHQEHSFPFLKHTYQFCMEWGTL